MAQPFAMDASVLSPKLRRSSSNNSLIGRSTGTPVPTVTPGGSGPGSPTQENARRAVDTLLSYIQNGAGDSTDYYAVLRLTEKLGLQMNNKQPTGMQMQQQQQQQQSGCLSGLPRIPEGEAELSHAPQPNLHPHMIKLEPTSMSVWTANYTRLSRNNNLFINFTSINLPSLAPKSSYAKRHLIYNRPPTHIHTHIPHQTEGHLVQNPTSL